MRNTFLFSSIVVIAGLIVLNILHVGWHSWVLSALLLPLILMGFIDYFHATNNLRRQYPLLGRISNFIEEQRHVVQETLLQNSREGRPFNIVQKEIVYKRASDENKTQPFGTQLSYSSIGREWWLHSPFPAKEVEDDFRIKIGGPKCKKPYSASILNIGGMSYGSISKNATLALNGGAKIGGFAQNTGEGGLTPYHEKYGADLIFQLGTGYFGCRDDKGYFDENAFSSIAQKDCVKMVEIKISQGAKPGFGAILPAKKNTSEIAKYRKVKAHTEIHSPAYHSTFSNTEELLGFVEKLRELSGGKPVGIKLCVGNKSEVEEMIKVFSHIDYYPDFITIDGAEGGTGAANLESLNWVGMPLEDALHFTVQTLEKYKLREYIKVLASGKIISAFDLARALILGADACYSARGMMFALGCVQSLKCNLDTCPTGITTMNRSRVAALVVKDKKVKVANYHKNTLKGLEELMESAGCKHRRALSKDLICRKVNEKEVISYAKLFSGN